MTKKHRHGTACSNRERGFTLVEMIVSIGLFAIVMLVALAAMISLIDANKKAQALQSVINNLGVSVDGMVRSIREGTNYRCNGAGDCRSEPGGTALYFERYGGNTSNPGDDWAYAYDDTGTLCGNPGDKRICKSQNNGVDWFAMTSKDVRIEDMKIFVDGSTAGDGVQPRVIIVIKGTAGFERVRTETSFHIQSTAVQRVLDI